MHGAKVALVVVSVFNTLNTIDCRLEVGAGGVEDAGIAPGRYLRSAQERKRTLILGWVSFGFWLHAWCFYVLAINMKQIYRRTESKGAGLAVLKVRTAAFERQGNDSARSRCVRTGPIMLLIKYPTSQ